jgi:IclR family transcriptional regulator, KDG regulon repressor
VTYVEVVPSEYALRLHERPGATVCLHASALGKTILAFSDQEFTANLIRGRELTRFTRNTITDRQELMAELRRVRERGYAFDRGETSSLATCVAAPITRSGAVIAAISISGPSSRFSPRKNTGVIEGLLKAVDVVSRQLRTHPEMSSKGARKSSRQH